MAVKLIEPSSYVQEAIRELQEQNRLILNSNLDIIQLLAHPKMVVSGDVHFEDGIVFSNEED